MSALYCVYALQVAVRSRFDRLVEKSIRDRYMEGLSRFALTVPPYPAEPGRFGREAPSPLLASLVGVPHCVAGAPCPLPIGRGAPADPVLASLRAVIDCGVLLDGGAVRRTWGGTA